MERREERSKMDELESSDFFSLLRLSEKELTFFH